jgi:undecaprenyl phosphate-alpha-L-ara4FN deformylase
MCCGRTTWRAHRLTGHRAVFGSAPAAHAAAGWQTNAHMLQLVQDFQFSYTSDTRGRAPFWPAIGVTRSRCIEIPTTLPTFDELIGANGVTERTIADAIFAASQEPAAPGHVFTLHAELEGQKLAGEFARLLTRWREMNIALVSMNTFAAAIDRAIVPTAAIVYGEVPGRSGQLAVQGLDRAA